jgi:hypothetical protein
MEGELKQSQLQEEISGITNMLAETEKKISETVDKVK